MILIFCSCVSEEEPVAPPVTDMQQAVEDAKAWFGPQEEFVVPIKSGVNARVSDQIKKVHWNNVIVHEEGRVIEIEITYNTTSVPIRSAKTINDIEKKKKDAFFRLILVKRETGGFDKFILKYFPEITAANQKKLVVNNYTVWSNDFSGDIQMMSWDEEINTGWYVQNGEKLYTYFIKSDIGKKSRGYNNAALNCTPIMEEVCFSYGDDEGEITCGGGYCDIPEYGIECFEIIAYEDPNCSDQYNPGSGPGTYTGPGGGGGSGSGSGGLPTLLPEEEIIRRDPSFQGTNTDCILGKLLAINGFQKVAQNFQGVGSEFDVILKIGTLQSSSTSAQTQWKGSNQPIEITFNTIFLGRSALEISRTVIHEMLHAEFYRALNTQSPSPDDLSFKETFEKYTKEFTGDDATHHNLMADKYVDYFADVLQQVHPQLGGAALANHFNYPGGYPNGIPREFYEAMAWQGLKEAGVKGWDNLTGAEKGLINDHLDKAQMGRKSCN